MITPLGQSGDEESTRVPILEYRGRPHAGVKHANRLARWSRRCGLAMLVVFALLFAVPRLAGFVPSTSLPDAAFALMGIAVAVSFIGASLLATGFGIVGLRRAGTPGVGGGSDAGIGLTLGLLGIAVVGLGIAATVAMNRQYGSDGTINRIKCQYSLRQINKACTLYANDNGGAFPQRLEQLLSVNLSPDCLMCPSAEAGQAAPTSGAGVVPSYIYLGAGLSGTPPANVAVACDRLENHRRNGIHVVYADGNVRWLERKEAEAFLSSASTARAGAPATGR